MLWTSFLGKMFEEIFFVGMSFASFNLFLAIVKYLVNMFMLNAQKLYIILSIFITKFMPNYVPKCAEKQNSPSLITSYFIYVYLEFLEQRCHEQQSYKTSPRCNSTCHRSGFCWKTGCELGRHAECPVCNGRNYPENFYEKSTFG